MRRIHLVTTLVGLGLSAGACSCGDDPVAALCMPGTCAEHQLCRDGTTTTPAECQPACEAGFMWDGATCVASQVATCAPLPAMGSIALRCEMEHRECVEPSAGAAECTSCVDGYLELAGACELRVTCTELMCSAQNRQCDPNPNARCTDCLGGFIDDGGSCRAPLTCNDITCSPGTTCVEIAGMDAMCRAGECPQGEVPRAIGEGCIRCTVNCANRPGGTGDIYPELATLADTCLCETSPGFFWDDGAAGGGDIRPCDEDADGWVRLTARRAMERTDDLAIRANARCSLRSIDRVLLRNDEGGSREVTLASELDLYEPERLDDPALLADAISQGTLPPYDGRALQARELNTLTKACVWKATAQQAADFNLNGLEDVDEAHQDPRLADPTDPLTPLYDFTYFIELDRGWYEAGAGPTDPGRYVIAEKRRAAGATQNALALVPTPGDGGDNWRMCERQRDAAWEPGEAGFDFAELDEPATWSGMGHHSQFRCLRVVANPSTNGNEASPEQIAQSWTVNRCTAGVTQPPMAGIDPANPSDPTFSCAVSAVPDPRTSTTAPVLLAVAKYTPYDDEFTAYGRPTYLRGCVNACAEHPDYCPGYSPVPGQGGAQCVGDTDNFGALHCGCGLGFAGDNCQLACPGMLTSAPAGVGHLFSASLEPAPRSGTWLCGSPVAGGGGEMSAAVGSSTSTWTLRGEIPNETVPTDDLCAPDLSGTGCAWRVVPGAP